MLTGFLSKLFAISCFRIHKLISFLFFLSSGAKRPGVDLGGGRLDPARV